MKRLFLILLSVFILASSAGAVVPYKHGGDVLTTRDHEVGRNLTVDNSTYVENNIYSSGISTTGVLPSAEGATHSFVDFNLLYIGSCIEGRLQWNIDDGVLEVGMPGGNVCLQIGQELMIPRAKNAETFTILNGQLVYISGASGQRPTMKLASASDHATARATIAMATEDVAPGQFGYFTAFGNVRDLGTFGYSEGIPLFLSTTAGDYTDTLPTQPDSQVFIGIVIYEHNTEGIIFVKIVPEPNLDELSDVLAGSYVDDDFLIRDTVLGVWKNVQLDTIADAKYVRRDGTTSLTAAWDAGAFDIKNISYSIGANTLDTQEWAFLDGQDQSVFTDSYVYFDQVDGITKWGGVTSGGLAGPQPVSWEVESFNNGSLVYFPRLVPTGAGLTPVFGGIANLLFIHADVGLNSVLSFANNSITTQVSFVMDEITGAFSYTVSGGGTPGTTWYDDFTFIEDVKFDSDGSGLSYGSMYNHDVSTVVTISVTNTAVRIPSGFTVGQLNLATFGNDREITVENAGRYKIVWSISFTAASANQEIEGSAMVDNIYNLECTAHRRISTATDTGAMSGNCILDLDADDVISLGVLNETSTANIIIEHSNMSLSAVGGS